MKTIKISFLVFWVLCTAIFLVGVLTPLDFTHRIIMYISFFVFINGIFMLSFLLTDFITIKKKKVITGLLISVSLILFTEFSPQFGSNWKTQEILYRKKNNPSQVIAFQTEDLGAFGVNRRNVKIIEVTPLFTYSSELRRFEAGPDWIPVNELVKQ